MSVFDSIKFDHGRKMMEHYLADYVKDGLQPEVTFKSEVATHDFLMEKGWDLTGATGTMSSSKHPDLVASTRDYYIIITEEGGYYGSMQGEGKYSRKPRTTILDCINRVGSVEAGPIYKRTMTHWFTRPAFRWMRDEGIHFGEYQFSEYEVTEYLPQEGGWRKMIAELDLRVNVTLDNNMILEGLISKDQRYPTTRAFEDVNISLSKIAKYFEHNVYRNEFEFILSGTPERGTSFELDGIQMLGYETAGRCMFTISRGDVSFTVIGDSSKSSNPRMGYQGFNGKYPELLALVKDLANKWKELPTEKRIELVKADEKVSII